MLVQVETIEQSILIALLLPHHLGHPGTLIGMACFTTRVYQQHRPEAASNVLIPKTVVRNVFATIKLHLKIKYCHWALRGVI